MFYRELVQEKYLPAFDNITRATKLSSMDYIGHLVEQDWVKDYWVDLFIKSAPFYVEHSNNIKHIIDADLPDRSVVAEGALQVLILHLRGEYAELCTQADIERLKMIHSADKVLGLLPNQIRNYKRHPRFVMDKILVDGQLQKATDVRIEPVSDFNGGFRYRVLYRKGIHLHEITEQVKLTAQEVYDIIYDCISERSNSSSKASDALTITPVSFRLVDPMYPTRCQTLPTEFGPMMVIRFFDFKTPFRIKTLGLDAKTEDELEYTATLAKGITLVSGGIGSGKGTTINAMALAINDVGKFSMISLDSPIEYLGNFPQVEYQSQPQLYSYVNSLKKLDINIALLNEIATQETAREVLNLVVSGVHVLTTLHNERVYNIFYKLHEQLGGLYTSLIPYLNYVSFQDKYSITCKSCQKTIYKTQYSDDPNSTKLLEFFQLDVINQPVGCANCKDGVMYSGIQVISEGLLFNDKLKLALIKEDLHSQAIIVKKAMADKSNNMENLVKNKLSAGDVLIGEVLQKLDTWR